MDDAPRAQRRRGLKPAYGARPLTLPDDSAETGIGARAGSGDLPSTCIGAALGGFWAEWPGNPNSAGITPVGQATWKLAAHGGSFRLKPGMPRYAGFEGHGMVDNFVLRRLGGSVQ